jgi:hypothetical protein
MKATKRWCASALMGLLAWASATADTVIYPKDNGFDAQDLGSGFYAYQIFSLPLLDSRGIPGPDPLPNHTPWTFAFLGAPSPSIGSSGIAANGSGFYVSNASNGDSDGAKSTCGQAAYLQGRGCSISQTVPLLPGEYYVTFDFEARRDYAPANEIAVYIDSTLLFQGAPDDTEKFHPVETQTILLKDSEQHVLTFFGLGVKDDLYGDHTTFIDNVAIHRVELQLGAR